MENKSLLSERLIRRMERRPWGSGDLDWVWVAMQRFTALHENLSGRKPNFALKHWN